MNRIMKSLRRWSVASVCLTLLLLAARPVLNASLGAGAGWVARLRAQARKNGLDYESSSQVRDGNYWIRVE